MVVDHGEEETEEGEEGSRKCGSSDGILHSAIDSKSAELEKQREEEIAAEREAFAAENEAMMIEIEAKEKLC